MERKPVLVLYVANNFRHSKTEKIPPSAFGLPSSVNTEVYRPRPPRSFSSVHLMTLINLSLDSALSGLPGCFLSIHVWMFSVRDLKEAFYFNALMYSHSEAYEESERKFRSFKFMSWVCVWYFFAVIQLGEKLFTRSWTPRRVRDMPEVPVIRQPPASLTQSCYFEVPVQGADVLCWH